MARGRASVPHKGEGVFYRDGRGDVFHTYSSYARGNEEILGAYMWLDLTPKGRNETGPTFSMGDWVRHHDRYGADGFVDSTGGYHEPQCPIEERPFV
jgi:predicted dithiol-disulfide oxidoreductase (DUF899 family)